MVDESTKDKIEELGNIVKMGKSLLDTDGDGNVSKEEIGDAVEKVKGVIGNGGINWVISALSGFILTMLFIIGKDWLFEGTEQWDLLYYVMASTLPTLMSFLIMKPVLNKLTGDNKIKDKEISDLGAELADKKITIRELEHAHEKLTVDMQHSHQMEMFNKQMTHELNIAAKNAIIDNLQNK